MRVTRGTPRLPKPLQITVADEFTGAPVVYDVKAVRHFCTPVDVDGGGIREPSRYLTCYKVRPASGEPKHGKRRGLFVTSEIGGETIDTRREDELCLPTVR